jgi:ubiquinone/menaquinone biosynthesis C-methylase UbiE
VYGLSKRGNRQLKRGYQYGFSDGSAAMFDTCARRRKARTMVAVIKDYMDRPLQKINLLNIGGSAGIIDNYLSDYFAQVVSIDIDDSAINHAKNTYKKKNLEFKVADALDLPFSNESFDVVVCSQVYEHVPNAKKMFAEIFRVLSRGGVCYFAANNRLMLNEPHYKLPLLSVMPRALAHFYMRLAGKGNYYYEKHLSYWGLKSLVKRFKCIDYTLKIVFEPAKYRTQYMVGTNSLKTKVIKVVLKHFYWASPGYIWLLQKPLGETR